MIYRRGNERRRHYAANGAAIVCVNEALKAAEYYRTPLLIHYPYKVIPYGFEIIAESWFVGHTIIKLKPTWFGIITKDHKRGAIVNAH